jgi:hypothetical protein
MRPTGTLRSVAAAAFLVLLAGTLASSVGATPNPNSVVLHTRVFNDCPSSVLTTGNSYPASISIDDGTLDCFGFANLHTWRFSTDGVNAVEFANGDNFRFGADLVIDGTSDGEAGLQISPWWSQDVDGRFNVRSTDGEIACFGGRMPFYSFTGSHGIVYVKGTSIHVQITYIANGNTAADPARIEYQVTYGGTTYSSGFLPFDEGNPAEDPPHGVWGMLTPAYVGGHFQAFLQGGNPAAAASAVWTDVTFQALDPASAVIVPRVFNDCPSSTLTTQNAYPDLISINDQVLDCFGFANLHVWRFSEDGTTPRMFSNGSMFGFSADLVITGTADGEAGLQISPWWSPYVDGRFNVRTTDGEIACFGGRLPFYSFTGSHGLAYTKGTTIRLSVEYRPNGLSMADPATVEYGVEYMGMSFSSGLLPFDMANPAEDPPHGLWGILSPAYAGGHFQPFLQGGNALAEAKAEWSDISFFETLPEIVDLDIKPGTCPNPLNLKEKGAVSVAVLGSADLDVADINVSTLRLAGVPAGKSMIEDVAAPFDGDDCGCTTDGPDGYDDLVLKFRAPDLSATVGSAFFKEEQVLTLTGNLVDGTPIEGSDCIVIVGAPKDIGAPGGETDGGDGSVLGPLSLTVRDEGSQHHIEYVMPEPSEVTLTVYDVSGRIVERLVRSFEPAGNHTLAWKTSSHPSGIYFYQLKSGGQTVTRKAVVLQR